MEPLRITEQELTCCSLRIKRSCGKIYPNGYVEMLESQQAQLVSGLQKMYHRLLKASAWDGKPLDESSGRPLTHDILRAISLLKSKHDEIGGLDIFKENCDLLQSRLVSEGAGYAHQRAFSSSNSDAEHSHQSQPRTASFNNKSVHLNLSQLDTSHKWLNKASSRQFTIPRCRPNPKPQQNHPDPLPINHFPLHMPTFNNEPQLYPRGGTQVLVDMSTPEQTHHTKHALGAFDFQSLLSSPREQPLREFDYSLFNSQFPVSQRQMGSGNGTAFGVTNCASDINDLGTLDAMSIDLSECIELQIPKQKD